MKRGSREDLSEGLCEGRFCCVPAPFPIVYLGTANVISTVR